MKNLNTRMQNMKNHTFLFITASSCMVLMILLAIGGQSTLACWVGVIGIFSGLGATKYQDAYHRRLEEERVEEDYRQYLIHKTAYNLGDVFTYSEYKRIEKLGQL